MAPICSPSRSVRARMPAWLFPLPLKLWSSLFFLVLCLAVSVAPNEQFVEQCVGFGSWGLYNDQGGYLNPEECIGMCRYLHPSDPRS